MTLQGRTAIIVLAVLGLSVVANIFAASFAAGRWSGTRHMRIEAVNPVLPYPPAIRADVMRSLREKRSEIAPAMERLRRARLAMFEAARAPTLDRDALKHAMNDVRDATNAVQEISQDALIDALAAARTEDRTSIRPPQRLERRFRDGVLE